MTDMRRSFRVFPRALGRAAVYAVAIAQMVLGIAPIIDGRAGPDARAHIEASGTKLHHAHDETDCAACLARHLLAATEIERPQAVTVVRSATRAYDDVSFVLRLSRSSLTRSRAPPAFPV